MVGPTTVQLAERGVIVLPEAIRDSYDLQPGDSVTLIDLDGVIVISPHPSAVNLLADRLQAELAERGESLDSLLEAAQEERDQRGHPV